MVNQSVNEVYTRFLFKINALPQDVAFPLDIATTFSNKFIPDVREFLISEGVRVSPRPPTETNIQINQRLLLVRNSTAEVENKTRTTKAAMQPEIVSRRPRTFMGMIRETPQ